ncbi:MAG: hypothetical protein Q9191_001167 [Dirinaria sp. TL-2023a]
MFDIFLGALAFLSVACVLKKALRWRQSSQFSRSNSCQAAPAVQPYDYLGLINLYTTSRHFAGQTALRNITNLFDKHGRTFTQKILTETIVFTCDPRNLKHILVTGFADYDVRPGRVHIFKDVAEHGILALDGQEWKAARAVYRDEFSHTRSILDLQRHEYHIENLLREIHLSGGAPCDLQPLFLKLVIDLTTAFALGESSNMLSPSQTEEQRRFVEALVYVKKIMARDGFMGPLHVILSHKRYYKACQVFHGFVERRVKQATEKRQQPAEKATTNGEPTEGYNMLHSLTEYTSDAVALREGVESILIAAIDTVASLLTATFYLLARDERVFQKLRKNILDGVGHREPTYDEIKSFAYLRHVFNEGLPPVVASILVMLRPHADSSTAMRLYPGVPFSGRVANKDTVLPCGGGPNGTSPIVVSKGEQVIFSSWASHRSVQNFGDDAHEFRPERWEHLKVEGLGYIPFHLGPRACPGQHYALASASYVTIRMLQTFAKLEPRDTRRWQEQIGLSLLNANGVVVALTPESRAK